MTMKLVSKASIQTGLMPIELAAHSAISQPHLDLQHTDFVVAELQQALEEPEESKQMIHFYTQ